MNHNPTPNILTDKFVVEPQWYGIHPYGFLQLQCILHAQSQPVGRMTLRPYIGVVEPCPIYGVERIANPHMRFGNLGITIDEQFRGKGLGTYAVGVGLHCLKALNISLVYITTQLDNHRMKSVCFKHGPSRSFRSLTADGFICAWEDLSDKDFSDYSLPDKFRV